jgi:hypothetical protein
VRSVAASGALASMPRGSWASNEAELIVNNRHAFTTRIYRKPEGPLRISVSGLIKFASFEAWQLQPISPDRLTI